MSEKIYVDVQPVVEMLKRNLQGLGIGLIRALRGTGKNEGYFLIVVTLDPERDLKIKVNVQQMFENKDYFKGIISDIHKLVEDSNRKRFESCRIMG